jgi:hypothetical protein
MENNANFNNDPQSTLNTSYSSLKKFVNSFFEELMNVNLNQQKIIINFVIDAIDKLEFPYVLLFNDDSKIAILMSLFYEDGLTDLISKLLQKCVEKFHFESKVTSSIEIIINATNSLFIPVVKKSKELTNLENIYLEYKNVIQDCLFFKNYLEEITNEDYDEFSILEILKRIKQMISTNYNSNDFNYPVYVYDFLENLSESLSNYEDYFIKKLREIKKDSLYTPFSSTIQNVTKTEISQVDIRHRTYFYYDELLAIEEGLNVEYKNYRWPLSSNLIDTLKNQICGFLNSLGGRVYIGVNDDRIVKGVYLKPKKKDLIRNQITNFTCDFWPKCRTNKIEVTFIPVKTRNKSEEKYLENIYVIKIIVKQGNTNKLYSTCSKGFNAYVRLPGQCVLLSAEEIADEIIKRRENPKNPIEEKAFFDPQAENGNEHKIPNNKNDEDINMIFKELTKKNGVRSEENKNKSRNNIQNLPAPEREINIDNELSAAFTITLQNIPKTAVRSDVFNLFLDTNFVSERIFVDDNGNCLGWAFINYESKTLADNALKKFKGATVKGTKINAKLKFKSAK